MIVGFCSLTEKCQVVIQIKYNNGCSSNVVGEVSEVYIMHPAIGGMHESISAI